MEQRWNVCCVGEAMNRCLICEEELYSNEEIRTGICISCKQEYECEMCGDDLEIDDIVNERCICEKCYSQE